MANNAQFSQRISTLTAQTTSVNTDDQEIPSLARTAIFMINVTAASGTSPTLTAQLQAKGADGVYYNVPGAVTASITGTGNTVLIVGSGVGSTANVSINAPVPQVYRLAYTIAGTTPSFTFNTSVLYGY